MRFFLFSRVHCTHKHTNTRTCTQESDYEDDNAEQLAAQSIELKDYKEEVVKLRRKLTELGKARAEELRNAQAEVAARDETIRTLKGAARVNDDTKRQVASERKTAEQLADARAKLSAAAETEERLMAKITALETERRERQAAEDRKAPEAAPGDADAARECEKLRSDMSKLEAALASARRDCQRRSQSAAEAATSSVVALLKSMCQEAGVEPTTIAPKNAAVTADALAQAVREATQRETARLRAQAEQLQTNCTEAFAREEEARKRAAQCAARAARLQEENTAILEQYELNQDQLAKNEDQLTTSNLNHKETLQKLDREVKRLTQQLRVSEEEAERAEDMVEEKEAELRETYAELKSANVRARKAEEALGEARGGGDKEHDAMSQELETLRAQTRAREAEMDRMRQEVEMAKGIADDFARLREEHDEKCAQARQGESAAKRLQAAMERMEQDARASAQRAQTDAQELEAWKRRAEEALRGRDAAERRLQESEREREKIARELSGAQRYTLKLEAENKTLRRGYEKVLEKVRALSAGEQMVDRRLVVRLIVTYFEQNYDDDVLDLMARMLQFSEQDKKAVGLGTSFIGRTIHGVSSWLFNKKEANEFKRGGEAANERDKNLADLWVEFLLHETDAGGKKKKKKGVARVKLAG